MTTKIARLLLILALALMACMSQAAEEVADVQATQIIEKAMRVGDSEIISCKSVTRVVIGNPEIADVAGLSSKEILLNAKSPGNTLLHIWDSQGRALYKVMVQAPEADASRLCDAITAALKDPRIEVQGVGNTIMLEGTVSREAESSRAEAIAQAVVETAVFKGNYTTGREQEVKSVSKPEGESFTVERVVTQKDLPVVAQTGLRAPKVINLICIEKPIGEVSVRTLEIANAIREALQNPALTIRPLPGGVVMIEGRVGTQAEVARVDRVLKGWAKEGKDDKGMSDLSNATVEKITMVNNVVLDTSVARQVMVRAKVVDIDRQGAKDLGVDWWRVVTTDEGSIVVDQPIFIGEPGPGPYDIGSAPDIMRLSPIGARVQALITQNRARVLSEPNLLVLDGQEANMLVGGEIPVPVVQSAAAGSAVGITIEYKEFGVRLRVVPSITGDDTLQLKLMPEVSSLDYTNSVVMNGFRIPGLQTRRAETTVNIRNGQSLIIGGLIQSQQAKLLRKIPLLGSIPVIGEFFKTRSTNDTDRELVIIVTPEMIRPTATASAE